MSDMGRQSLGDKAGAALKPESQKSLLEQGVDMVKGKADSAASSAQPDDQKSTTQKMGDAVSGNSNKDTTTQSYMDSAKQALGLDNNAQTGNKQV